MNLTKEQAQRMLKCDQEWKAKLEELQKQYEELYENAKNTSVYEFRTKVRELNQKRAEIVQQLREDIEKTINVEQLQNLMQTYRLRRTEMFAGSADVWETAYLLVNKGALVKRQGKGTFVTGTRVRQGPRKLSSFSEEMATMGLKASSIVLEKGIRQADEKNSSTL